MLNWLVRDMDSILYHFHKTVAALEAHVETKVQEHIDLHDTKEVIQTRIDATAAEIDRGYRVLDKVKDLVA